MDMKWWREREWLQQTGGNGRNSEFKLVYKDDEGRNC